MFLSVRVWGDHVWSWINEATFGLEPLELCCVAVGQNSIFSVSPSSQIRCLIN